MYPSTDLKFTVGKGATLAATDFIADSYAKQWNKKRNRVISVPCTTMTTYLLSANITHVNFFSLDVEGAEFEVLSTIDFNLVTIDTFWIELDNHDPQKNWKVQILLSNLGYVEKFTIGANSLFVLNASRAMPDWR